MMYKNRFIYLIMAVMIGGILGVGVLDSKENYNSKLPNIQNYNNDIETININNNVINKKEGNIVGNISLPVISIKGNLSKSKEISNIFKNEAIKFYNNIKNNYKNSKNYVVDVEYEVMSKQKNILSIYTMYNNYDSDSVEYHKDVAYNIDLRSGKILNLKDLFIKNYDYEKVINEKIEDLINKANYDDLYKNFKGIESNQSYFLKEDKLIVYFEPGQIAKSGIGNPRFEIPISLFGENFKDEYISN